MKLTFFVLSYPGDVEHHKEQRQRKQKYQWAGAEGNDQKGFSEEPWRKRNGHLGSQAQRGQASAQRASSRVR